MNERKISVLGIFVGGIVDVLGTSIVGALVLIPLAMSMHSVQAANSGELTKLIATDPLLFSASFLIGSAFSILGGVVAATMAKANFVVNGALSAWLCVLTGVLSLMSGAAQIPVLLEVADFAMSPALGALGGYIVSRRKISA